MSLSYLDITIRLLAALLCGLLLGRERKQKGKPVGSRTHIIICMAAALISMISTYGFAGFDFQGEYRNDPARLVVGILTGIGFIGAGIIWKDSSGDIRGITTAANVYLVACLGIAIGMGLYFLAGVTTVLTFCTLEYPAFVKRIKKRKLTKEDRLNLDDDDDDDEYQASYSASDKIIK